jgi:hypothetical protein
VSVEDDQARRFNDRIAPAIRAWGERVYSGLDVDPRSSLAADDALPVRGASVSWLVGNSILHAVDNLVCLVDTFDVQQRLYINAMDSLLRSAFVGAVQAQWILFPPSRLKRQNRALVTWKDDWRNRGKALDVAAKWYGASHSAVLTADRQKLEDSTSDAKTWAVAARASGNLAGEAREYSMTDIVSQVAAAVFPDASDGMVRSVGLAYTWKRLSSSIHATPSSALSRLDRATITKNSDGSLTGQASADPNQLITDLSAIVLVLSDAWRLFDLRSLPLQPSAAAS